MTTFDLNGRTVEASADHPHLLAALRDELRVTSPKDGCAPSGQCGCCTVLLDGKARVACQTSMERVEGVAVTTVEGLTGEEREQYATAFAAHGALQCGFCTPGIVMRAKALIDRKGEALTREEAARHLGAHLCRCTGYVKILDAVESLASGDIPVPLPRGGVGSRGVKVEASELSLGDRPFIDDLAPDGLLHAALRLADHARADIVSIDTAAAEEVNGVHRVLTAADVPGALRVGIIHTDWPVMIPEGGRTSYLGDVLAVVVADDRETAREAAALVAVEQVPRTVYSDPVVALQADEDAVWELDGNVLSVSTYSRGDVEAALAGSAHVVEEVFQTQRIEHAFVEPESTLAVPTDDGLICTRVARGYGTTATRSPRCWESIPGASPSSWYPTAGRSAVRRTCVTRPTRRWPPGCCNARFGARFPGRSRSSCIPSATPSGWPIGRVATPTGS